MAIRLRNWCIYYFEWHNEIKYIVCGIRHTNQHTYIVRSAPIISFVPSTRGIEVETLNNKYLLVGTQVDPCSYVRDMPN